MYILLIYLSRDLERVPHVCVLSGDSAPLDHTECFRYEFVSDRWSEEGQTNTDMCSSGAATAFEPRFGLFLAGGRNALVEFTPDGAAFTVTLTMPSDLTEHCLAVV